MRSAVVLLLLVTACNDNPDSLLGRGPSPTVVGGQDPGGGMTADNDDDGDPTASSDGTLAQMCVDYINSKRATLQLAPLARWSDKESCADGEAKSDAQTNRPHGAFPACGEMAQNECPGWSGEPTKAIKGCLDAMWNEGPGGGHYENMASTRYSKVSCGVHVTSSGRVWSVQNFR